MAKGKKYIIKIKEDYCKSCRLCYSRCPTNAITANPKNMKVQINDEDKCIGCLVCENICPDFAIEIFEAEDN
ncbi:MAG: 4Fe-4S dicluster domain-containing protein [Candidatus Mcinerneyibacterium aminivorans]|uniref:4Fe-4S dicluster domain-containing protein n=1 Tax=Candidatus Mcinerneyibacterium aminivorans TaxID=2703815 RepID=A0A5D0MNI4_9BACT|nr:MAG: 4Fe-4S dicluster domain-containing protein [Candidatus Mcinerneyibacterium aminivorans]